MDTRVVLKDAQQLVDYLEKERQPWDVEGKLINKYVAPRRSKWSGGEDIMPGTPKSDAMDAIVDSTVLQAMRVCASGLQTGITPSQNRWFKLGLHDSALQEWGRVRVWLDDVEQLLYWLMARSNWYQATHAAWFELIGYGTGHVLLEPHPTNFAYCRVLPFGSYALGTDRFGQIDTQVWRFHKTAKALCEEFNWLDISDSTRKAYKDEPYKLIECLRLMRPRRMRDRTKIDFLNQEFEILAWESASDASRGGGFLDVGGSKMFDALTLRWDVCADDVYGHGPGHEILPESRLLQSMASAQLMGIQKSLNPPMRVPGQFKKRLSHIPGGQNAVDVSQPDALAPLYMVKPDLAGIAAKIEDVRRAIRSNLFVDLFAMFSMLEQRTPQQTATEILEKKQEKMTLLGPMVERAHSEFLDPAVRWFYWRAVESGLIPPAPPEIQNWPIEVEYVSVLSQAQKLAGSQGLLTLLTLVGQAAQADPNVVDKLDLDQVVDEYARMTGAPARVIRDDTTVQQIREQRAQAAQRQQALEQAAQAVPATAQAAKAMSETYVQGQPALDSLVGMVQ